jgi:hypothetical protein
VFSEERLITRQYDPSQRDSLEEFCLKCNKLGYYNNMSLEAIKLDWCIKKGGQFFLTYYDNMLVGLSGCHPLPQVGENIFRLLFRGIELPEYRNIFNVISKTHMTSVPFYYHVPLEIEWAKAKGATKFVVTTNWNNPDGITSMSKSHRVFQLLEKQGIVSCLADNVILFETEQSVWELNLNSYFSAREGFRIRNGLQ